MILPEQSTTATASDVSVMLGMHLIAFKRLRMDGFFCRKLIFGFFLRKINFWDGDK